MEINGKKKRLKLAYSLFKNGYIDDSLIGHYEIGIRCTVPDKFTDFMDDCDANNHHDWFSNYRYKRYGDLEDCKVCKWNTKPKIFVINERN